MGKLNGVCHSSKDHKSAETICASYGARLCTKGELEGNCAADTGCELNDDLVWSSTLIQFSSIAYNSLRHCHPARMGNNFCDGGWYLTSGCEDDEGDCDGCKFEDTSPIGDGICDEKYNNWGCGFDGGDCQLRHFSLGLPVTSLSFSMGSKYL